MKKLTTILLIIFANFLNADDFNASGLNLSLNKNGTLKNLKISGESHTVPDNFNLFSIVDPSNPRKILAVTGNWKNKDNKLLFDSNNDPLKIKTKASISAEKEIVKINIQLKCQGNEKGAFFRFALPVNAKKWMWWDDIDTCRIIKDNKLYENTKSIRANADLPEFAGQPGLKMGYYAQNFCSVISDKENGLCYAVPLDQPRIFRTGYDSEKGIFYIVYDIGFSKDTKTPMQAEFTFYILNCNGKKGMRSALSKYYQAFPLFFSKNVKKEGQWLAFSDIHPIDNADEFDLQFRESNGEGMAIDDKLGLYTLSYYAHAGMIGWIPGYKPGISKFPDYETQLKAMIDSVAKKNKRKGLFKSSATKDADGKYAIRRWSMYGHLLTQTNMDPNLAFGKFMLDKIKPDYFKNYRFSGAELDGLYYDGLSSGLNYNKEHFKYAEFSPIWDPANKRPVLYNFFSSVAFARAVYNRMRNLNKYTMLNGSTDTYFMSPYVDISALETHSVNNKLLCQMRTNSPLRPFLVALKGDFIKEIEQEQILEYMEECVSKGIYPGLFDIGGAQGPGSRYWEHSFLYDRDRMMHRKYQVLCQKLNDSGWNPFYEAELKPYNPKLYIEQFGKSENNENLFITIINKSESIYNGFLELPKKLFAANSCIINELNGLLIDPQKSNGKVMVPVSLAPNRLMVIQIGKRDILLKQYISRIATNLDKYQRMVDLDKKRPEQLKYWRKFIAGGWPQAVEFDGKACMELADSAYVKGKTVAAFQYCMPYQSTPETLSLKISYYCDNIKLSNKGSFKLNVITGHVNTSTRFTERKNFNFVLPVGSRGWQTKEFKITPDKALRSVKIIPTLYNANGKVYINQISLTSSDGKKQYAKNPFMKEKYAKLNIKQNSQITEKIYKIEEKVKQALTELNNFKELKILCTNIVQDAILAEQWIKVSKIENEARREIRELKILTKKMWTVLQLVSDINFDIKMPLVFLPEVKNRFEIKSVSGNFNCKVDFPASWKKKKISDGIFDLTPVMDTKSDSKIVVQIGIEYQPGKYIYEQFEIPVEVKPLVSGKIRFNGLAGNKLSWSLEIKNQSAKDVDVIPEISNPAICQISPKLIIISAGSTKIIKLTSTIPAGTAPGRHLLSGVIKTKSQKSQVCSFEHEIYYIPAEYNLAKNPSFEKAGYWSLKGRGGKRDAEIFNTGKYSMRLDNITEKDESRLVQSINLNQKSACPVYIRCYIKTQELKGKYDKWASLYIDFFFNDGTKAYGKGIKIPPGTNDWKYFEMVYKTGKPIKTIGVHLMLRNKHTGTVWFDDIFIGEDPNLKGNLAIGARPSVDSKFHKKYNASTINDGEIRTDIHWTKESWASREDSKPHWAVLDFGRNTKIGKIKILWSMDGGLPKTSKKIHLQTWNGGKWTTINQSMFNNPQAESVITLLKPVTTAKLRVWQPAGSGSKERPEMMWIREIQVYEH